MTDREALSISAGKKKHLSCEGRCRNCLKIINKIINSENYNDRLTDREAPSTSADTNLSCESDCKIRLGTRTKQSNLGSPVYISRP